MEVESQCENGFIGKKKIIIEITEKNDRRYNTVAATTTTTEA